MNKIATLINTQFIDNYINNKDNECNQILQLINKMNSYIQQNENYNEVLHILDDILNCTQMLSSQIMYLVNNIGKPASIKQNNDNDDNDGNEEEPDFLKF